MSRGPGKVQTAIIGALAKGAEADVAAPTHILAAAAYGIHWDEIPWPAIVATRRALKTLQARGLVVALGRGPSGHQFWTLTGAADSTSYGRSSRTLARQLGISHTTVVKARRLLERSE